MHTTNRMTDFGHNIRQVKKKSFRIRAYLSQTDKLIRAKRNFSPFADSECM